LFDFFFPCLINAVVIIVITPCSSIHHRHHSLLQYPSTQVIVLETTC
jgi:hypothetical protein